MTLRDLLRRGVSVLLFVTLGTHAFPQFHKIDSLKKVVTRVSGTTKVDVLNQVAFGSFLFNIDSADRYAGEALRFAEALRYKRGIAEALTYQGIYQGLKGNNAAARRFLTDGQSLAHEAGARALEGYALVQLGNMYRNLSQLDSARNSYDASYQVLKDSLNPWQLSSLYRNMAIYYGLISDHDLELTYLLRSWKIREKLTDKAIQIDGLVLLSQWYARHYNLPIALDYLNRAEKLSSPDTQLEIKLDILEQKAVILFQQGRYHEALIFYKEVKDYYQRNSIQQYVKLLLDVGYVFEELSNYELSLKNYFEAMKLAEDKGFRLERVKLLVRIGWNYYLLNQLKSAEEFTLKAIEEAKQNNYFVEEADAQNSYGNILSADNTTHYNEAIVHLQRGLQLYEKAKDRRGEARTLNSLGDVLELKNDFYEAERTQLKGLAIHESIDNQPDMAWSYLSLGRLYMKMGNTIKALHFLDKAESTARHIGLGIVLIDAFDIRKTILEQQGKLQEALQYSHYYEQLKDSVFNKTLNNRIASLQSFYELETKDNQIELLNKSKQVQSDQIEIQRAQIRQQGIILASALVGFLLISAVAYTLFRYFRKVSLLNKNIKEQNEEIQAQSEELMEAHSRLTDLHKQTLEQKEEIQAQSEELTENNQIISLSNQSLEKKVEQRTRELTQAYKELDTFFYRSSHDFRRPLTTFMGLAEVAKIAVKDTAALELFEKVDETARNLDKMLMKLQSISDLGSQELIYKEVFIQELFELVALKYNNERAARDIDIKIDVRLKRTLLSYPALIKISVENLVENSIQFCAPEGAQIELKAYESGDAVVIEVVDNGEGIQVQYHPRIFDMYFRGSERSRGNGLGLFIVKKVVEKLRGRIEFKSELHKGTSFTIILPLVEPGA